MDTDTPGLIVKAEVAYKQLEAERVQPPDGVPPTGTDEGGGGIGVPEPGNITPEQPMPTPAQPKRFHGTVTLDTTRVGRDASRIADEVIAHLSGLVGAQVTVTLEVEAEIPSGAPDHVVRVVSTENSRTLNFTSQGLKKNRTSNEADMKQLVEIKKCCEWAISRLIEMMVELNICPSWTPLSFLSFYESKSKHTDLYVHLRYSSM